MTDTAPPRDCRDCHYAVRRYMKLQCLAMNLPKPVEFMRHEKSDCGPNAAMFEPLGKKYEEHDNA